MTHRPTEGTCQGDFALTVKEILPIDEYESFTVSRSAQRISHELPRITGTCILTDRAV